MKASLSLMAAWSVLCAMAALAFAHVPVGGVVENVELTGLDGVKRPLLTNAAANVFVFFKPGQENSRTTLVHLAVCQKELSAKPVSWVAVVSDRYPKAEVEAMVKETGLAMPVLIDAGDALYGKLGVALCPVLGIADQDHKLAAYEHFTKINFAEVVQARIRYLLKEISKEELEKALNPSGTAPSAEIESARLRLKLGEKLFAAKSYAKALESVNKSIEKDPSAPAAHILKGRILAAQGNKDAARAAFSEALKLDPSNAEATSELKALEK